MPTLILDIETIGEEFDLMDKVTQKDLTKRIRQESSGEAELETKLQDLKDELAMTKELMTLLGVSRDEGERVADFEKHIKDDIEKVLKIE